MWRSNTLGGGKIRPAAGIGRRPRQAQGQRDRDAGRHPSCTSGEGATSTIPIVFTGGDPVEQRPGRRSRPAGWQPHGLHFLPHRVGAQAVGAAVRADSRGPADRPAGEPEQPECLARRRAASVAHRGVQLPILKAATESEIDAAFASLVQLHGRRASRRPDPFFNDRREQLVALASRHALATCYEWRE